MGKEKPKIERLFEEFRNYKLTLPQLEGEILAYLKTYQLSEARSLLRSALSIAERKGEQTNWEGFRDKVRSFLNKTKEQK